jgi:hypothetical protein
MVFKAKNQGLGPERLKEGTPGRYILTQTQKYDGNFAKYDGNFIFFFRSEVSFAIHAKAVPPSKQSGILRFQNNKGKNWGPKRRAFGSASSTSAHFTVVEAKMFTK